MPTTTTNYQPPNNPFLQEKNETLSFIYISSMKTEYAELYDNVKGKRIIKKKNTFWQKLKSFFTVNKKELKEWIEKNRETLENN